MINGGEDVDGQVRCVRYQQSVDQNGIEGEMQREPLVARSLARYHGPVQKTAHENVRVRLTLGLAELGDPRQLVIVQL